MRRDNVNYFWVGIFVLSMIALLIAVLFRITGEYTKTEPYYVKYSEITDIHVGTEVTYGGYQIGQVSGIIPQHVNGKTVYKLKLSIKSGWKIPEDSVARIVTPRLLSESSIDILEGNSPTALSPGGVIQGQEEVTAASLLRELNENLKPLIMNLNNHINTIGDTLETDVPRITANINQLVARFNQSAGRLEQFLSETNRRHLAHVFENADTISTNLRNLSHGFNKVNAQLNRLLKNSNALLEKNNPDIHRAVVDLRSSLEIISQNVNEIIYNLNNATRGFSEFSREIRENPSVLIRGKPARDEAALQK